MACIENLSVEYNARYNAAGLPTMVDGKPVELQTDDKGRLYITASESKPLPVDIVDGSAGDSFDYYGANAGVVNDDSEVALTPSTLTVLCEHTITNAKEAIDIKAVVDTINGIGTVVLRINDGGATPVYTILAKRVIHRNNKPEAIITHIADAYLGDGSAKIELAVCSQNGQIYLSDLHLREREPVT